MGHGFNGYQQCFQPRIPNLLDNVLDLTCIMHCHWLDVPDHPLIPDRHWTIARSFFIAEELIGFKGGRDADELVRLALIIWMAFSQASTLNARSPTLPPVRAAADTRALHHTFAEYTTKFDEASRDGASQLMLFWVAGLGAVVCEVSDNQEWFAVQFQRFAKKLEVFSWEGFAPIQEMFLMLDTLKPGGRTHLTWLLQRAIHADVDG